MKQVDTSLAHLGADHVDLYQDRSVRSRDTGRGDHGSMHDVVKAGKIRHLGATSMRA